MKAWMGRAVWLVLCVLAVQAGHGCAQPPAESLGAPAPARAAYPESAPLLPGEGTGNLRGSSSVSPAGQYTYRLPIEGIPPGRAGMQPALALVYASGGDDGHLGVGWRLEGGLSEIRRCRKTRATEGFPDGVDFDDTDAFCLDGQKLRQLNAGSIANGHEGAEYRTERDTFARVVAHRSEGGADGTGDEAGPDSFTVQARDGRILEYRTRVEPHRFRGGFPSEPLADLGPVRAAWLLQEARDRWGNAILYDYDVIEDAATRGVEHRIKAIRYTARDDGAGGVTGDRRRVEFSYVDRGENDRIFRYESGVRWETNSLLAKIALLGPNPDKTEEISEYRLSYVDSPDTARWLLSVVQRCDAGGACLRGKQLRWSHRLHGDAPVSFREVDVTPLTSDGSRLPDAVIAADFDGDGLDDVLHRETGADGGLPPIYLSLARLDASGALRFAKGVQVNVPQTVFSDTDLPKSRAADLDGDGRAELLAAIDPDLDPVNPVFTVPGYQVFRWSPVHGQFERVGPLLDGDPRRDAVQLGDQDGDGLIDLFQEQPDNGQVSGATDWGEWLLGRNIVAAGGVDQGGSAGQGDALFASAQKSGLLSLQGQFARALDVDGDGRADLLPVDAETTLDGVDDQGAIPGATIALGLGDDGKPATDSAWRLRDFARLVLVDLNGDGLPDALYPRGPDTQIRWNLGNGFAPLEQLASPIRPADSASQAPELGLRVGDFDGDGRQELVSFDNNDVPGQEQIRLFRLRGAEIAGAELSDPGEGTAPLQHTEKPAGGDAHTVQDGWPYCTLGDFNGDGLADLLQTRVEGPDDSRAFRMLVLVQEPAFVDLLSEVADAGAPEPRESISYARVRSEEPLAQGGQGGDPQGGGAQDAGSQGPCAWPSPCVRRGLVVVSQIATAAGGELHSRRYAAYSYEDPRIDLQGRGFLGFGKVTVFDPQLRAKTVTTYDHATRVDLPSGGSLYPYAGLPASVLRIAPIFEAPTDGSETPELPDGPLRARVTTTTIRYNGSPHGGGPGEPDALWSDKASGTYIVHAVASTTLEFETYVAVTDGGVEIAGGPDPDGRRVDTQAVYDDFENVTSFARITDGGTFQTTSISYDNRADTWLLGLPWRSEVLVSDATHLGAEPRVTTYDFDERGSLVAVTVEPDHPELTRVTTYHRNADGLPKEIDVAAAGTTRKRFVDYDALEGLFPADTWNDLDQHEHTTYHPGLGLVTLVEDPNGVKTRSFHDGFGRVRRVEPDGGEGVTVSYASTHCKTSAAQKGMCTSVRFDSGGEQVAYSDELGRTWEVGDTGFDGALVFRRQRFNVLGQPVSATRPFTDVPGPASTTTFDSLDRPTRHVGADTAQTSFAQTMYATARTDANGHTRRIERDKDGRVVRSYEVSDEPTRYTYGPFDQVVAIEDPLGHVTAIDYDVRGHRTRLSDPDQGTTTFEVNGYGELRFARHRAGKSPHEHDLVTEYQYDALGRVHLRIDTIDEDPADNVPPETETTEYDYDPLPYGIGKLGHTKSPDGIETSHTYDERGRPKETSWTVDGQSYPFVQEYDSFGRPTVLHYPAAPGRPFAAGNGYNPVGWLRSVGRPGAGAPVLPVWQVDARTLDGALAAATWNTASVTEERGYSPLTGRLHDIVVGGAGGGVGGAALVDVTYGYDLTGNVTHRRDAAANRTEDFLYDDGDRLTDWTLQFPTGQTGQQTRHVEYRYDELSNLTEVLEDGAPAELHTPDPLRPHQLASINFVTGAGLLSYAHDARGRVRGDGAGRKIDYTPLDLPRDVTQPGLQVDFAYDAFGARVKKTSADAPSATTTTTLTLAGLYEKRTREDAGGTMVEHVYFLRGDDGPVAQVRYDEATHEETTAYLTRDGLGSISTVFDTQGKLLERFFHEPFGQRTGIDGKPLQSFTPSSGVALGFTGERHDDDLGWIDLHGRVYDPVQKRFLTPDPVVSNPWSSPSFNRYAYALNNPLRFTDPSGFDPEPAESGCAMGCSRGDLVLPQVTIRATPPKPDTTAPAPAAVQTSDAQGPKPPTGGTAAPVPPSAPSAPAPPAAEPPSPGTPGRFVEHIEQGDVGGLVLLYGERVSDGLADGASYAWGALTFGAGYFWGQALKEGGELAIDGVADGDPQEVLQGALKLGETALEITDTPQKIADALTTDGDSSPARDGAPPRNAHLAGKTHPKTGVPFDTGGYPDFKAAGVVEAEVKISQTGTRAGDFKAANEAAGFRRTPEGYTWHHHQDGTTMQLVPRSTHARTGHTGGFGQ
jgi:RHS repeat-associated protein